MIADTLNNCLTIYPVVDNLAQLSHRAIAIGIGVPKSTFQKYSKSKHKSIMSGCLEGLTTASPLSLYANSLRSDTIELAFLLSGLIPFQRKPAMSQEKSTQQTTHTETPFSKVPQTVLNFSDEGLASLPNDYLAETVKDLGKYQDYCYKMAGLAEEAMVRIESILNSRVGGV